jgi:hypothetical protein
MENRRIEGSFCLWARSSWSTSAIVMWWKGLHAVSEVSWIYMLVLHHFEMAWLNVVQPVHLFLKYKFRRWFRNAVIRSRKPILQTTTFSSECQCCN